MGYLFYLHQLKLETTKHISYCLFTSPAPSPPPPNFVLMNMHGLTIEGRDY